MDKIEVTERAREAATKYYGYANEKHLTKWDAPSCNRTVESLAKDLTIFERDILATRTDATPVAWMYERPWDDVTPKQEVRIESWATDCGRYHGWTETPLYTHPPATDVAALVEAAKKIMPIRVNDGPDYAEVYFADGEKHSTHAMTMNPQDWLDLSAALASFTKGQNDEHS